MSHFCTEEYSLSHQSPSPVDEGEVDAGNDGIKVGWDKVTRHILQVAKHLLHAREECVESRQAVDAHLEAAHYIRLAENFLFP